MTAEGTFPIHWIPLFPLFGAILNLLFGSWAMRRFGDRTGREFVHLVAIGAVAVSCFIGFSAFWEGMVVAGNERLVERAYTWIVSGETVIGLDFLFDRLSAVLVLVITGVGLLIHIFSVGYMAHDKGYARYFAYLNLFTAAMLVLVLGKSLVLMFVGWEGVGLCSYLLIGFWFDDDAKATAGRKAFIVNRIGDFGFILGLLAIYAVVQSLDVDAIRAATTSGASSAFLSTNLWGISLATAATLLLFVGCCGKSAQIPLYVWLPDAMAGPTPVSALIHAATMVTAGVYLCVRLNFLFALAPLTMAIIAIVGALTALFAATIGITQTDIKKVLAYSTVSQLGYMFLAVGMGAWVAAIFHLVTHAFFKACLFLGSGSVIEACHHDQDIRNMGGLKQKMPVTSLTFFVSCLAIAGIVPFSGFFSKDEILVHAYVNESIWSPGINVFVWLLGSIAAACTAFYMFRLYYLTFEGRFRGDPHTWEHHVHEVPIMNLPLVVLAFLATIGGLLGLPHVFPGHPTHRLHDWLEPITSTAASFSGAYYVGVREAFADGHAVKGGYELLFMAISLAIAVGGWMFARRLYRDGISAEAQAWATKLGGLYRASLNKYWVDEFYDAVIVRPLRFAANVFYRVFDLLFVDGVGVYGVANTVGAVGNRVRTWHNGNVRRYMMVLFIGVGIVLASIYANPTISQVGTSSVHTAQKRADLGGLRPTLGVRPYAMHMDLSWIGLGKIEIDFGPKPNRPKRSRRPAATTEQDAPDAEQGAQQ